MADELTNLDTDGDLIGDNAETPDDGEVTASAPEDEVPEESLVAIDEASETSSDAADVENSLDAPEAEQPNSEVKQPNSEVKEEPLELPPLDLDSLDAEIAALQAEPITMEDADDDSDEEDDSEPEPSKSISVELTDAELAALDAEIAAQLDAEAEGGDAGDEWYFVHTYSGMENKVKKNLEHRIESMGMADLILQVVVPTETEVEIRKGVRKEVEKRVFPGYILVNMVVDEDSWYVVRNTPGVTGFVGMGNKPTPLSPDEVSRIMERLDADEPRVKISFQLGEQVRITGGPFAEFNGIVEEIYADKGKAKVMVSFFNRETPVEVDFVQLEREE